MRAAAVPLLVPILLLVLACCTNAQQYSRGRVSEQKKQKINYFCARQSCMAIGANPIPLNNGHGGLLSASFSPANNRRKFAFFFLFPFKIDEKQAEIGLFGCL